MGFFNFSPDNIFPLALGLQTSGALMGAAGSFYSGISQASSLRFQSEIAAINARIAEREAENAFVDRNQRIAGLTLRAGQIQGAARATMGAGNIGLNEGSAAELQASNDVMKEMDRDMENLNAIRAAFGYRTQATGQRMNATLRSAQADMTSPFQQGFSSLLGSADPVAKDWYIYSRGRQGGGLY